MLIEDIKEEGDIDKAFSRLLMTNAAARSAWIASGHNKFSEINTLKLIACSLGDVNDGLMKMAMEGMENKAIQMCMRPLPLTVKELLKRQVQP